MSGDEISTNIRFEKVITFANGSWQLMKHVPLLPYLPRRGEYCSICEFMTGKVSDFEYVLHPDNHYSILLRLSEDLVDHLYKHIPFDQHFIDSRPDFLIDDAQGLRGAPNWTKNVGWH